LNIKIRIIFAEKQQKTKVLKNQKSSCKKMQLDFLLVHYSLKKNKQNQLPNGFFVLYFYADNQIIRAQI
jgi:hypothetical protein